ncbi:cysteine-rich CWC family protein [Reinekea marinisedimentorum]|uniref:Cysteine-rich CWC n=1 Tax=Reinekea marinisedimentorum TaxID=230495 RepID=A0A4R3I587_9GAMM|nr:cysteine-rich CWC family protein [Reinekea marinisedimentorum]TCS41122.1 Cysteine-rich CWC [Reinekea marinisedimentorum]
MKQPLSNQCPICLGSNQCSADTSCWCMQTKVPEALIALAKKRGLNSQCICKKCIDRFEKTGSLPTGSEQ